MSPEAQRTAIAKACGWRAWAFGDPLIAGQCFRDSNFRGYPRKIVRVYGTRGATLDVDDSPIYPIADFGKGREYEPANGWLSPKGRWKVNAPDYLNNLNAMHDAWLGLSGNQKSQFAIALHDIVRRDGCGNYYVNPEDPSWIFESYLVNATAAQRAEAFLKTLDLWEDNR